MSNGGETIYYVIYDHPIDYPNKYVVRKWISNHFSYKEKEVVGSSEDIVEARKVIPEYYSCRIERVDDDDPTILEL